MRTDVVASDVWAIDLTHLHRRKASLLRHHRALVASSSLPVRVLIEERHGCCCCARRAHLLECRRQRHGHSHLIRPR